MKGLLVLILAALIGYAAYTFVYPRLAEMMKFEKHKSDAKVVIAPVPAEKSEMMIVTPPRPEPKIEIKPEPKPQPKMAVTPEPKKPEAPKYGPNDFIPPVFPPIEVVVQNWNAIPKSAFPRPVKLKRDLSLSLKIGNSTAATQMKAGGQMIAVGQEGTNIFVSPTDTSPMRGEVAIDETDLKETLTDIYERWKVARLETLKRAHEFKLAAAERAKNAPPTAAKGADSGPAGNERPKRNPDGTYPLLVASMKAGQVTEITPEKVKEWGDPQLVEDTWTVIVKYETQTMFGKFDTEAQAQIKNGKVEKWIYTGSGEVVP